jgi:hypothetical protein
MIVFPSLVPAQQADVCPKNCHVNFFVELTANLTAGTKLINEIQIQGLFRSFSSVKDQNDCFLIPPANSANRRVSKKCQLNFFVDLIAKFYSSD